VSTAEHTDALTRRIEQLAAAALDEGDGAALAALIAALRSEIGAVRVDVGSLRSETGGLRSDLESLEEGWSRPSTPASARPPALVRRFATELDETVTSALDDAARATAATGSSLDDARGALESRLAVLEDVLDGLSERIEALARDGAVTTTAHLREPRATVRDSRRAHRAGGAVLEQVVDGSTSCRPARRSEQRLTTAPDAARPAGRSPGAAGELAAPRVPAVATDRGCWTVAVRLGPRSGAAGRRRRAHRRFASLGERAGRPAAELRPRSTSAPDLRTT
jgi:hypothetical protein